MTREAMDATAAAFGSKAAYTGAGSTIVSWMLSSEFGVLAGLVIGLLGLLTNWYFQHRRDRREQREHERRMKQLSSKPGDLS